MRVRGALLVLGLSSVVTAGLPTLADAAAGDAAHPHATALASCGDLAIGSTGKAVATLQNAVGTKADGGFGPKTRTAVKRWQRRHGLPATGVVDAATWAALPEKVTWSACGQQVSASPPGGESKHCATLARGDVGAAVAVLQKRLGAGVDGGFGPKTRDAVEAAQTAHGQQPTGKVTYKLWHALGLTSTPACEPGPAPISGGSGASGGSGSSGGSSGGSKGSSGGGDSVRQARIRARVAEIVDGLNGPAKTSDPVTHRALRFARTQIGKPYVYGGDGPNSYDCSGLVMAAYDAAAVALPRTAAQQYAAGPHVPLQHVRRGDLVYFASDVTKPSTVYHTGIYVGNGEILDAPHTGTDVQIQPLWATDLLPRAVRPTRALQLPVKRGDTGHTVSELQTALDHHGFNLGVDGGDGPQTTAAVKAWQAAMGTKQTGTVTKALWLTLGWNP